MRVTVNKHVVMRMCKFPSANGKQKKAGEITDLINSSSMLILWESKGTPGRRGIGATCLLSNVPFLPYDFTMRKLSTERRQTSFDLFKIIPIKNDNQLQSAKEQELNDLYTIYVIYSTGKN